MKFSKGFILLHGDLTAKYRNIMNPKSSFFSFPFWPSYLSWCYEMILYNFHWSRWYEAVLDWGLNRGPPALKASTMPLGYRGGGMMLWDDFVQVSLVTLVWCGPWLGIEPWSSRTRSQHYTTRLARRRYDVMRWFCTSFIGHVADLGAYFNFFSQIHHLLDQFSNGWTLNEGGLLRCISSVLCSSSKFNDWCWVRTCVWG